jgi:hypothetical protein
MTLIELTVVILVLLGLIFILFMGARAYKRGSGGVRDEHPQCAAVSAFLCEFQQP